MSDHMERETFWLVEVPGGDRRYIQRSMTPERYAKFKADKEGTRIFKITVDIPSAGTTHDHDIHVESESFSNWKSYL